MSSSALAPARRHLATLRARIFQHTPPPPLHLPAGVRTGAKLLKRPLVGPAMLEYYPPSLRLGSLGLFEHPEEGEEAFKLRDAKEVQRLKDVERKKKLGKGPPKKGQGRRAAMKGKKK